MSSERVSVRADLRRKFQSLSGVGPATATKCADAAMEYLDSLVQNQARPSAKPGERDEDGIEMVKRPEGIPKEYNYLYWGTEKYQRWVHHFRPTHLGDNHYTCSRIDTEEHQECNLRHLTSAPFLEDFLDENRITKCELKDRIVRLVD